MSIGSMAEISYQLRQRNPFATRWVRPGAIPYLFKAGVDTAQLVQKLKENGWCGAIIGPHGSGKSTFLATLVPSIEQMGICVRQISLYDSERRLPPEILREARKSKNGAAQDRKNDHWPIRLLTIEGYEQLRWWARQQLWSARRRCRLGLLVTVHAELSAGELPVLFRTVVDLETVQFLVDHVLPPHGGLIQAGDVVAAFNAHGGNVRETLFALYDLFEQRRLHPPRSLGA